MKENCKCFHHWVVKVVVSLAWLAGVLFFWTSFAGKVIWGFESIYYAWVVVVLSLLTIISKYCGCCEKMTGSMSGMCGHDQNCKCGDCGRCK